MITIAQVLAHVAHLRNACQNRRDHTMLDGDLAALERMLAPLSPGFAWDELAAGFDETAAMDATEAEFLKVTTVAHDGTVTEEPLVVDETPGEEP